MDRNLSVPKRMKLLFTIGDRGKGEKVAEVCRERGVYFNLICLGRGTANSDILNYLGIGETDKDIVLSSVVEEEVDEILRVLVDDMEFSKPGKGIAFTVPIGSVGGPTTLQFLSGMLQNRGE